jgi:hypothetical protein
MRPDGVLIALLASALANLLHHAHNAEFLELYPNMPAWLSPVGVYAAWSVATAVGAIGYFLLRRGYRLAGFTLLIVFAAYGLDGLVHYALAPAAAHTLAANLSIWLEAAAASALLAVLFQTRKTQHGA